MGSEKQHDNQLSTRGRPLPPSDDPPNYPPPPYPTNEPPRYPYSHDPNDQMIHQTEPPLQIVSELPPRLPTLVKGQKIKSGPYMVTVTEEMVAERERQNEALYREWLEQQRLRNMNSENREREEYMGQFRYAKIRRAFIRKVFCIVALQLLFTTAITTLFIIEETVKEWVHSHMYLVFVFMVIGFVTYIIIICCENLRKRSPWNCILLCVLTLSWTYMIAFVSTIYNIKAVIIACAVTMATTFVITLLATFTKCDLTNRSGLLLVIMVVVLLASVGMIISRYFMDMKILHLIFANLLALCICVMMFITVQEIMGGRRAELTPNEVVYAVAQLYHDIIFLYHYLLLITDLCMR